MKRLGISGRVVTHGHTCWRAGISLAVTLARPGIFLPETATYSQRDFDDVLRIYIVSAVMLRGARSAEEMRSTGQTMLRITVHKNCRRLAAARKRWRAVGEELDECWRAFASERQLNIK
jgi:hypothetical protein